MIQKIKDYFKNCWSKLRSKPKKKRKPRKKNANK